MGDKVVRWQGEGNKRNGASKFKRRNKKSRFMSNVKGFGRKGNFGRGANIDEDEFSYFVNIMDAMRLGFETLDDKVTMANNVFEQTREKEIHLSSNQIVCKTIETLIGFTDTENFERFVDTFAANFRPICSDEFVSHILQKMIEICFLRSEYYNESVAKDGNDEPENKRKKQDLMSEETFNLTHDFSTEHRTKCSEFVLKIGKFLLNNIEDFVYDVYGSHIMRSAILCLAGIREAKVAFEKNYDICKHEKPVKVPKEWTDVVLEYANRLQLWPQFSDLPYNTLTSPLLGHIFVALRAVDKTVLKSMGKKVLVESFLKVNDVDEKKKIEITDDDSKVATEPEKIMPKVFSRESSVRLLETLLATSGRKLFTQLNAMLFAGRLKTLASNRSTNFAVQRLIAHVYEQTEFESIFDELQSCFEDLLKLGHTKVVEVLAATCLRLSTKQGAFVAALQAALHVSGSKEKSNSFITCVLKLKPYELAIEDKSQFMHLHGSVILQHMFEFSKPIKLVQCFLEIPSHDLALIFCSSNGSHIADTFIRSKSIGEKSREKLIKHLEGNYLDMAITKFGSRVVENLFAVANDGQKSNIVKELSNKVNQLQSTMFGKILFGKLRVDTYRLSATQWKASFNRANKAESLFENIIK